MCYYLYLIPLVLIGLLAVPQSSLAQSRCTYLHGNGMHYLLWDLLNLDLNASTLPDNPASGVLGLKVGYGFTPLIAGYVGLSAWAMDDDEADDAGLGFFELGAQLNFRSGTHALVPYAGAALSSQAYGNDDVMFNGGALSLVGGVTYFFSPGSSSTATCFSSFGNFNQMEVDGDSQDIDEVDTRGHPPQRRHLVVSAAVAAPADPLPARRNVRLLPTRGAGRSA